MENDVTKMKITTGGRSESVPLSALLKISGVLRELTARVCSSSFEEWKINRAMKTIINRTIKETMMNSRAFLFMESIQLTMTPAFFKELPYPSREPLQPHR